MLNETSTKLSAVPVKMPCIKRWPDSNRISLFSQSRNCWKNPSSHQLSQAMKVCKLDVVSKHCNSPFHLQKSRAVMRTLIQMKTKTMMVMMKIVNSRTALDQKPSHWKTRECGRRLSKRRRPKREKQKQRKKKKNKKRKKDWKRSEFCTATGLLEWFFFL